jgi:hypothetical protein
MKYNLRVILLCICLLTLNNVHAQHATKLLRFGVKGGINLVDYPFGHDMFKSDNREGFFIGPNLLIHVPIVGLDFDIAALYNDRKTVAVNEEKIHQKTIDIPLYLRKDFRVLGPLGIFVGAGPQVSFQMGDKDFSLRDVNWKLKESYLSVNVGGGVTLSNLQLAVNYGIPIGNTANVEWKDAVDKTLHVHSKDKIWQLSLSVLF